MEPYLIRSLIMRHGTKLDLRPNEKECLWHLLDFDFDGKGFSWPSIQTIMDRMGIKWRNGVKKIIKSLVTKGLIDVYHRVGDNNEYHFDALIEVLTPFLEEEISKAKQKSTRAQKWPGDGHKSDPHPATKVTIPLGTKVTPNSTIEISTSNTTSNTCIAFPDFVSRVISYLNEAAKTNYQPETPKTVSLIKARFNEGFRLADFQVAIDKKVAEWKGTEFEQYLRPQTLFGTKFEAYLNQNIGGKKLHENHTEQQARILRERHGSTAKDILASYGIVLEDDREGFSELPPGGARP